jgi:hypothetical protein
MFWFGKKIIVENFNIFEDNIISVELAKVLVGYFEDFNAFSHPCIIPLNDRQRKKKGEFSPLKNHLPHTSQDCLWSLEGAFHHSHANLLEFKQKKSFHTWRWVGLLPEGHLP